MDVNLSPGGSLLDKNNGGVTPINPFAPTRPKSGLNQINPFTGGRGGISTSDPNQFKPSTTVIVERTSLDLTISVPATEQPNRLIEPTSDAVSISRYVLWDYVTEITRSDYPYAIDAPLLFFDGTNREDAVVDDLKDPSSVLTGGDSTLLLWRADTTPKNARTPYDELALKIDDFDGTVNFTFRGTYSSPGMKYYPEQSAIVIGTFEVDMWIAATDSRYSQTGSYCGISLENRSTFRVYNFGLTQTVINPPDGDPPELSTEVYAPSEYKSIAKLPEQQWLRVSITIDETKVYFHVNGTLVATLNNTALEEPTDNGYVFTFVAESLQFKGTPIYWGPMRFTEDVLYGPASYTVRPIL